MTNLEKLENEIRKALPDDSRLQILEIIREANSLGHKIKKAVCKCKCGNAKTILYKHVISGKVKSCGCYLKESRLTCNRTHGKSKSKIYNAWMNMIARCNNPKSSSYHNYGGRGIKVCDDWVKSFQLFYSHVGDAPSKMELDRIDVNGNYEPSNVRWVSRANNMLNTRANVRYNYRGQSITITEIQNITNIPLGTIVSMRVRGKSIAEIEEFINQFGHKEYIKKDYSSRNFKRKPLLRDQSEEVINELVKLIN
jgi:hypothetical protein